MIKYNVWEKSGYVENNLKKNLKYYNIKKLISNGNYKMF